MATLYTFSVDFTSTAGTTVTVPAPEAIAAYSAYQTFLANGNKMHSGFNLADGTTLDFNCICSAKKTPSSSTVTIPCDPVPCI
jgi:hypothetical protein